ncbi:GNAT family N-acetyltransferase [uncultured Ruegeria sp.]|uniref:GNAT family N-acetyltransferase n=1 Tax=uncultured Ruegeria sp. TaxID=259304 RepID=UPI002606E51D|nr:GNAT family N-acetyltransferase [uncultured Ruegeria sp.]
MLEIRQAVRADATEMSRILIDILNRWHSSRPGSAEHVRSFYIDHPDITKCSVASDEQSGVVGFQSLKITRSGNRYKVPAGWGVIGTYVSSTALRRGVGSALFRSTLNAAADAGIHSIDAMIGAQHADALGYYEAMGFRTYRSIEGAVGMRFDLP